MEVVQDYEALEGSQNKIVIKELVVTAEGFIRTFLSQFVRHATSRFRRKGTQLG